MAHTVIPVQAPPTTAHQHTPAPAHASTRTPATRFNLVSLRLPLLGALTLTSFLTFALAAATAPYELATFGGYNDPLGELAFTGGLCMLAVPAM